MIWSLLGGLMPPAVDTAKENKVKSTKSSGDSGNCSEAEEEQNTNRATRSEFKLTQSLLSQVRADKNNADANSGKQAYKDLPRMNFIINGKTISKDFVGQLCDRYNQELQSSKRQVVKHVLIEMFKHAKAEVPDDHILKELITNCNQAGYDGSLLMQLFPIFFEHNLQLPDANDRKISIICNSQDSLNIQYCPSMPVKQQDTNIEICRLDAILEFTLKSQNGKVEYEEGKVTLTILEQLKTGRENLLDDINKYFKGADNAVVAGSPAEVDSDVDNSFDIIPKSLAFDKLVDIINKAKNGDYTNLDEVMGNIKEEKDDIPINPDLKDLKDFCSQQLNLTAQTDHERVCKVLIEKIYKKENGTVKELVLLAIAANDTLVERCVKMHEGILFTQDEELDSLLIGAGKRCYIKFLLEHLEKELDSILSWRGICEKLKRASSIGNQECVEAILNRFEDTESRDPAISSKLLHYAVEKGDYDLVNSLIKNDANVNIQDRNNKTALHYAVSSYGDIQNVNKMVMLLVESGAKIDTQDSDGKTALHYAAASNKDEIVRLLLKEGANEEIKDKSGKTFLDMVASGTKSFLLNVLRPEGLLHHAAMEGNIGRVKRLLEKGKDVNAKNGYGQSPLSVAIQNNRLKIVKLFLEERAKIGKEEVNKAIGVGNLEVIELLVSKDAVITEKAIQYARGVYEKCEEDKKQAHSSVLTFLVNIHIRAAIEQGNLERIKSLVNECTVIARGTIQCARDAYKNCKEDRKQAHSSVLTFLVDIYIKEAIGQGNLKKIESYVKKGAVITEEIVQYAKDVCKNYKEDRKQAHSSVLKFLEKTSKDQFKKAIEAGNLEVIELLVSKNAVITEETIQYAKNVYEYCKERKVYIAGYPGGMKVEERNRTEILNFLKDNVRSNSNLVNETATSSQVVNEEDNNQSENPGLESAGSKQPQENVDKGENIMNNREGSTEELINFEEGEMGKNRAKKRKESIKRSKEEKKKNEQEKEVQFRELYVDRNDGSKVITEVDSSKKKQAHVQPAEHVPEESAKLKAQPSNTQEQQEVSETPVPEQTDDIESLSTQDALVPQSKSATVLSVDSDEEKQASLSDEVFYDAKESMLGTTNSKDGSTLEGDSDKQESQPKSVPTPLVANEISEQKDGTQTSTRQQEVFPFYPYMQNGHVLPSGSLNPITEMGNTQNLQSAVLSSQQLAFRNVIEIFNKHGREGFTSLKLVVQEFLRNGISEIQLPTSNGYITLNLNTINKAGSEGLQNIVKVLTDSYKNGALNDRTRNAIETHDDIDDYRLFSEKDPTLTPTPVPTPNPILTSIPGQVPTSVPPVTSESSATFNSPQPSVANNKSEQVNDAQTTTKQLEEPISPSVPPTVHVSQNNIHVQPSNSTPTATATRSSTPTTQVVPKNVPAAPVPPVTSESSGQADNVQINGKQSTNPSNIANASSDVNSKPITKEPVVTESNQQNSLPPLSSFDLSSPQRFVDDKVSSITGVLRSEVSIEDNTSSLDITDDEYSEDSSVVSEDSLIEDVTDEKEPLLDKINKGDSTLKSSNSPQSTKSSKLPVIAASALAIAGIISGVAVAVYLEMLAVGIAVGACCLVAAVIMYCCNRPSSSFKGSNVELIADEELAAQQTVN